MTKRITTESGSKYEIDGLRMRRFNDDNILRGDAGWLRLAAAPVNVTVGLSAVFLIESLAHLGPDSFGTPTDQAGPVTTRVTTPIVSIEEVD